MMIENADVIKWMPFNMARHSLIYGSWYNVVIQGGPNHGFYVPTVLLWHDNKFKEEDEDGDLVEWASDAYLYERMWVSKIVLPKPNKGMFHEVEEEEN